MDKKLNVFLMGGDGRGWALDTELRLARLALEPHVHFVDNPQNADIVHTVWPEQLIESAESARLAQGKPIVASFSNDPVALFEYVPGLFEAATKWFTIAQSTKAEQQLQELQLPFVRKISYPTDFRDFYPIEKNMLEALRQKLAIPTGKYIIGSFQRDSLGNNVHKIKPQKGADIFLAIILGLSKRIGKEKLHILLAGPRRHWIREKLQAHSISFSFAGTLTKGDDYPQNILQLEEICKLTNILDVNIVSSRWEGAPRAIMETILCKRKIISTDVGIANDILEKDCIYHNISQAIDILEKDFHANCLAKTIELQYQRLQKNHSVEAAAKNWGEIYRDINQSLGKKVTNTTPQTILAPSSLQLYKKIIYKITKPLQRFTNKKTITIWGEMVDGPYGGASQVLKAIAKELERREFYVLNNAYFDSDGHILNSTWFNVEKAKTVIQSSQKKPRVIHRIDGPISLYRGKDRNLDDDIFSLNRSIATTTAFQAYYSWKESVKMGFYPINPMIIRNACDPTMFYPKKFSNLLTNRIKLISSSWSTNMRKGFVTYQYLDEHLDFSRFEYTFVGRSPVPFKNIKLIEAAPSQELGEYLRSADIYISASLHDPASNALLEAINCGLPAVFANSGGHSEFAWFAGLPFDNAEEIPKLLQQIIRDYESYQICTYAKSIQDIADSYLLALGLL